MRRFAILAAALVVCGVAASPAGARDTRGGPACTDIVAGDFGYNALTGQFGGTMTLGAAACTTYELDVYNGTTLIGTPLHLIGAVDPNDPSMTTIVFSATVDIEQSGVCIVGTSTWKGRLADRAPDRNRDCIFVEAGSAGGNQGFT
jgi:hypothetical protein